MKENTKIKTKNNSENQLVITLIVAGALLMFATPWIFSVMSVNDFNPNSAIEKKEYFSILISNCVAVEKNKR